MSLAFRVVDEEIEGKPYHCGVAPLENAVLVVVWEGGEPRFGSLTVTLPGSGSSQLLGDRDTLLGRTLGAYASVKLGKMSLVSTNLSKGYSEEVAKGLLDLVKRALEEKG